MLIFQRVFRPVVGGNSTKHLKSFLAPPRRSRKIVCKKTLARMSSWSFVYSQKQSLENLTEMMLHVRYVIGDNPAQCFDFFVLILRIYFEIKFLFRNILYNID